MDCFFFKMAIIVDIISQMCATKHDLYTWFMYHRILVWFGMVDITHMRQGYFTSTSI